MKTILPVLVLGFFACVPVTITTPAAPVMTPTSSPSEQPSPTPVAKPSATPSHAPTSKPSSTPTQSPSSMPVAGLIPDPLCSGIAFYAWPKDSSGWTVLPASTQTSRRNIYVSGKNALHNDANNYWVQTEAQALPLMRQNAPDSLLFNRGETFLLTQSLSVWNNKSVLGGGSTPDQAKVIGAYGTGPRPILIMPTANSMIAMESNAIQNLIITQLDLEPNPALKVQGSGITLWHTCTHCLVEDVKINGFLHGMDIEQNVDFQARRNVILNSCGGFRAQGIYAATNKGFKLEENFMDNNGLQVCGDPNSGSPQAQGVYSQDDNFCVVAQGNVMTRALGAAMQARVGGEIIGNVFAGSNTALNFGVINGGSVDGKHLPRGVGGSVVGNWFAENGQVLNVGNTLNALVSGNVISSTGSGVKPGAAIIPDGHVGVGIHGLTVSNNAVSGMKYFVSYQWSLPQPTVLKNDGSQSIWTDCDGVFKAAPGFYTGIDPKYAGVQIWDPVPLTMASPTPTKDCPSPYDGKSMNGADLYSTSGAKLVDSPSSGIVMLPTESAVTYSAPDMLSGNNVKVTYHAFETGQVVHDTNPAPMVTETGDNLNASFVNPAFTIASDLYSKMAQQSHDHWDASITAPTLIGNAQAAYRAK